MTDMVLLVNGQEYSGWTSARVTRGIEQICGAFELSVTERWADQTVRGKIRLGDACALLLDGQTVVTGYVDDIEASYDAASREVTIRGRDVTSDLVDCSVPTKPGKQTHEQTFPALAQLWCTPHGVTVQVARGLDLSKKFHIEAGQEGESVFERLERLARLRGVLLVSDGLGALEITRASTQRIPTRLVLGENIMRGRGSFTQRDLYYRYTVKAQQQEADNPVPATPTSAGTPSSAAIATDNSIRSNRELTILAEGPTGIDGCRDRANWECNVRAGRGTRLNYTVQGWTYDGKTLWPINRLVQVVDEWLDIDKKFDEFLIVAVEYTLSADGTFTEITLCDPQAFNVLALTDKGAVS